MMFTWIDLLAVASSSAAMTWMLTHWFMSKTVRAERRRGFQDALAEIHFYLLMLEIQSWSQSPKTKTEV